MKDFVNMIEQVYKTVKPAVLDILDKISFADMTGKDAKGWLATVLVIMSVNSVLDMLTKPSVMALIGLIACSWLAYTAYLAYRADTGYIKILAAEISEDGGIFLYREDTSDITIDAGDVVDNRKPLTTRTAVSVSNNLDNSITVKYSDGTTSELPQ